MRQNGATVAIDDNSGRVVALQEQNQDRIL